MISVSDEHLFCTVIVRSIDLVILLVLKFMFLVCLGLIFSDFALIELILCSDKWLSCCFRLLCIVFDLFVELGFQH